MPPFSFERVAEQVREALIDHRQRPLVVDGFRRAAVLVPVLARPLGATVLLTRRTQAVTAHKGEISFPGGASERGEDAATTALREAMEEIALAPASVDVIGALDDQATISSYVVTPVIGLVAKPPRVLTPQPSEVAEPLEVPLSRLLDPAWFKMERTPIDRLPPGSPKPQLIALGNRFDDFDPATREFEMYSFDFGYGHGCGRSIWGMTARVLKQFLALTYGFPRVSVAGSGVEP